HPPAPDRPLPAPLLERGELAERGGVQLTGARETVDVPGVGLAATAPEHVKRTACVNPNDLVAAGAHDEPAVAVGQHVVRVAHCIEAPVLHDPARVVDEQLRCPRELTGSAEQTRQLLVADRETDRGQGVEDLDTVVGDGEHAASPVVAEARDEDDGVAHRRYGTRSCRLPMDHGFPANGSTTRCGTCGSRTRRRSCAATSGSCSGVTTRCSSTAGSA